MVNKVHQRGKLTGIAIAPKRHEKMECQDTALVSPEWGISGDSRGKRKKRQVTILFEDDWSDVCSDLGESLHWTARRANFLVGGGVRAPQIIGTILVINNLLLRVNGETDPCAVMDHARMGLQKALMSDWRGGVCCTVIEGGSASIGDIVTLK